MVQLILPSLMAKNKDDLNYFLERYKFSRHLHMDVGDGKFISGKFLNWKLDLPEKHIYHFHLMHCDPYNFIKKNFNKNWYYYPHLCTVDVNKYKIFCEKNNLKFCLALKPGYDYKLINKIKPDRVIVLTVNPGKYGGTFLKRGLNKLSKLKVNVTVDGGINSKTIKDLPKFDSVVCGSYLKNSKYPRKVYLNLRQIAKNLKKST